MGSLSDIANLNAPVPPPKNGKPQLSGMSLKAIFQISNRVLKVVVSAVFLTKDWFETKILSEKFIKIIAIAKVSKN